MLDFLGLRWDRAYDAQFARCRFETGRVDAFQRDLGTDSVAALERCIGSTLRAYGYATTATSTEHFPANAVA